MNNEFQKMSPFGDVEETNTQPNVSSYNDRYKQLYGDTRMQQPYEGYQQSNPYVDETIVNQPTSNCGNINYNNTVRYSEINPNQNVIVDNVANLNYVKNGYNNVSVNTSQYGLADLDAKDWFKYNMFLLIPIFNFIYYFYYGFFKSFIKYPILKEWSKSAIINSICIDIFYVIVTIMII